MEQLILTRRSDGDGMYAGDIIDSGMLADSNFLGIEDNDDKKYSLYEVDLIDRLYSMVSIGDIQVEQTEYDNKKIKLGAKASGVNEDLGYQGIMPDDEDYKFVIQEFDGMTVSFEADSDAVSSAVSDLDPVEAAVFVDFTVIDWTGIAGETLEEHFGSDNCYEETGAIRSEFDTFDISNPAVNTIGQLLAHLKTADYGTDKDIYGNTYNNVYSWFFEMTAAKTITQAQQRAYYQQHLANSQYYNSRVDELEYHDAEDPSDLDDTDQDTMSQFDGYDQVIGNLELDEDNNYIYEGAAGNILIKDFTTAVQFDYTTIDNDSNGVTVVDAGETSIVNDSPTISSTDWSYDYGLSDKLIYDDRVMNDVNTFEVKSYTTSSDSGVDNTLGPVILGEIEYYVNKDTSTTYEYSGKVSDEARYDESHVTSSRNLKSLERELSPVHSF